MRRKSRLGDVGWHGGRHVGVDAEQFRGASRAICSVTALPQSPPWATISRYPRRFINTIHARAMRIGSQPVGSACRKAVARQRRNHHVERVRCASACAVGFVRGSMSFSCSTIEPGQPCVTMTGNAFGCFERTWMK